jgi:hypothetical protein
LKRPLTFCRVRDARVIRRGTQPLPPGDLAEIGLVELASHLDGVTAQQQPQRRVLLIDDGDDRLSGMANEPKAKTFMSVLLVQKVVLSFMRKLYPLELRGPLVA